MGIKFKNGEKNGIISMIPGKFRRNLWCISDFRRVKACMNFKNGEKNGIIFAETVRLRGK